VTVRLVPPEPLTPEQKALVEGTADLVTRVLRKFFAKWGTSILGEAELRSLGYAGLIKAAQNYDAALGVPFEIFARYRVEGAMLDGLRDEDRHRKLALAVRSSSKTFSAQLGDPSNLMKDTDEDTRAHLQQIADMNAASMMEGMISEASRGGVGEMDHAERQTYAVAMAALDAARSNLSERDRQILDLYYREGKELKEIAEIIGVSYASVRRYHTGVMSRLAAQLRGKGVHEAPSPDGRV
jgi:RNA polymerase sigma factor for flagellar operon FliA